MNIRGGDRRSSARFEIVGTLRGALELDESVRIVELSAGGALVESRLPMPVGALTILITIDNGTAERIAARVQQVRRASDAIEASRYLIAIEFLSDATPHLEALTRSTVAAAPSDEVPQTEGSKVTGFS